MGSLFQIVFMSDATREFSREDLMELVKGCAERNARAGITSLLAYGAGCFLQILEGEEAAVVRLFGKISHDPRHRHVVPLIHEPIQERCLPNSAMQFRDLTALEIWGLPSYGELACDDAFKCDRLLERFKEDFREMIRHHAALCPLFSSDGHLTAIGTNPAIHEGLQANRPFMRASTLRSDFRIQSPAAGIGEQAAVAVDA